MAGEMTGPLRTGTLGNGKNGNYQGLEGGTEEQSLPDLELYELRRALVSLLVFGSLSDAQGAYFGLPGSTGPGWLDMERATRPIRRYVLYGEEPYVRPMPLDVWVGVQTPVGDCQEWGQVLGNEARKREEQEFWEGTP